jgi:hypothetical protein
MSVSKYAAFRILPADSRQSGYSLNGCMHGFFPRESVYKRDQGSADVGLTLMAPKAISSTISLQLLPFGCSLRCLWIFQKSF